MKRFKIIALISLAIAAITTATIVYALAGVYEDIRGAYAGKASIKESSLAGNVHVKSYRWAELTITTQTDSEISAASVSIMLTSEDASPIIVALTGITGDDLRPRFSLTGTYAGASSVRIYNLNGTINTIYRYSTIEITTQSDDEISAASLSLQLTETDPSPVEIPLTGLVGSGSRPYCELYGTSGGMTIYLSGHAIFRRNALYSFTGKVVALIIGSPNTNMESSVTLKLQ